MSENSTGNNEDLTQLSDEEFTKRQMGVIRQLKSDSDGRISEEFERLDEEAIRRDAGKVRAIRKLLGLKEGERVTARK